MPTDTVTALEAELDAAYATVTAGQLRLLDVISRCERAEPWADDGARDYPQWLAARLGISTWAARRWIGAAHALPRLPRIAAAFSSGALSIDKVVELCRFATPETEARLVSWARRVTAATIRARADVAARPDLDAVRTIERARYLRYWFYDDGRILGLEGALPAEQGAVVAAALDRIAGRLPDIVADDDLPVTPEDALDARRADALVALASARIAADPDPDRATVVVHAGLADLVTDARGCEVEGGAVVHPETMRRLGCDCRVEVLVHDVSGAAVGIGRAARNVPRWLQRALRHRDRECTFPGCGARRFLRAHHILWWGRGGATELANLVLCCDHHHKLVHEHRWRVSLDAAQHAHWFRPDGREFLPGRAPPGAQESVA